MLTHGTSGQPDDVTLAHSGQCRPELREDTCPEGRVQGDGHRALGQDEGARARGAGIGTAARAGGPGWGGGTSVLRAGPGRC